MEKTSHTISGLVLHIRFLIRSVFSPHANMRCGAAANRRGPYTALLASLSVAVLVAGEARCPAAEKGFSSMVESFNSSIKSGFSKVSQTIMPKPKPTGTTSSDATSLLVKAKPSAKLYVAVANTYVSNGNTQEAADMFERALAIEEDHAEALVGLALLKDQQGAYGEAVILLEKAAQAHPEDAAVFNALGLCHATHGNFQPALSALERAVRLRPREPKYRNNIAMILVEMGRYEEAFSHFRTQYDDPVAHYNLAYLLQKRGDSQQALEHFAAAIRENPGFKEARTWYDHLSAQLQPARTTPQPQPPLVEPPQRPYQSPVVSAATPSLAQAMRTRSDSSANASHFAGRRDSQGLQPLAAEQMRQPATAAQQSLVRQPIMSKPIAVQSTVAQNAMQRAWSVPPPRAYAQSRPPVAGQAASRAQKNPQRSPLDDAGRRVRFDVLQPPPPPAPRQEPRHVNVETVASRPSIQRLPPIEEMFESPLPPETALSLPAQAAGSNQAPLPPQRTSLQSLDSGSPPASTAVAPLPGPTRPTAPPTDGATRAPMVYPLPPVDEYRR